MLEDLEDGYILHFKNGIKKVKKVEIEKVKVGGETKMKITAHFPNDNDNSKCDLDYWFYNKNGKLGGAVRSFLDIIKVEKPQKQKEEFDTRRTGFYKTRDGRIAEFLSTEANGREDNLLFRLKVGPRIWMGYKYLKNGCYLKTEIHENDLVEYLGTELPKPKADPKKYEFETQVIRIGKHM